jgi:hypothetical protein
METKKKKVYAEKYYPLVFPADPSLPIHPSLDPQPLGPWRPGIEHSRLVRGRTVTVVLLENGTEELLQELLVKEDVWKDERTDPLDRLLEL